MASELISIAIPNYNYAQYIGETIASVLAQDDDDIEILISDNASTDNSLEVVRGFADDRIRVSQSAVNLGFPSNLDRAVSMGRGSRVILLSSDDIMLPGALRAIREVASLHPGHTVTSSTTVTIDSQGAVVAQNPWRWQLDGPRNAGDLQLADSTRVHFPTPLGLLSTSMRSLRNPLFFLSTSYPRLLWERLGGYTAARSINPDKWFHWRLLTECSHIALIDRAYFGYRVHSSNQTAQASRLGNLKYLTDQYAYTWDVSDLMLEQCGLTRGDLADAFVKHDTLARAGVLLAQNRCREARRFLDFGRAVFPDACGRSASWWTLKALARVGPLGPAIARAAINRLDESE